MRVRRFKAVPYCVLARWESVASASLVCALFSARISRWFEQLRRLTKGSSELRCTPRSGKTPKQRSIHGAAIGTTPTTTTNSASAHPEECSTQRATANGDLHRLQPDGGKQLRVPPTRICELRYVLIAWYAILARSCRLANTEIDPY